MLDEYVTDNYPKMREMARTITRGKSPDWEELLHTCVLALYESDRQRIEGLIERRQLRYWLARMMMNQYNSSTSPYHYQYRKPVERIRNAQHDIRTWYEDTIPEKEHREELHRFIEESLSDLPYFDRMVTKVYYDHGHSLNTLSKATGISRTTLFKALKRTRDGIRRRYEGTR